MSWQEKISMLSDDKALPGRSIEMPLTEGHALTGENLRGPLGEGLAKIVFGLGCFWGAEKKFWELDGVTLTAVGYAGGVTENPTYEEVCSGFTGHTEVVKVVFQPSQITLSDLLKVFWEAHDPTQGMRQGNDIGTQYRSAIYVDSDAEQEIAMRSLAAYQSSLGKAGFGPITTEIKINDIFFYAEQYHQQYLIKIPNGYCGLSSTGISFEI
ncbi:MAG: peptide-methionine (S)-S-oxide reductase [Gammaproteobacteria bacterium]|nr:peptide-methionine (S)-S-oxide reductase [Gammaproteobacteria bacterium]